MATKRDVYKYKVKRGGKIIYKGITTNLDRAAGRYKARWPDCKIEQVGRKTTWVQAQRWRGKRTEYGW